MALRLVVASVPLAACTKHDAVDLVMANAYEPEPAARSHVGRYRILAGDMHVHVAPPDHPSHVGRRLRETLALATRAELDFVALTPHLWSDFYADPDRRRAARRAIARLRRAGRRAEGVVIVEGFEYSGRHGHIGAAFGDLPSTLDAVGAHEAQRQPGRFFRRYVRTGGILVINHPYLTPFDSFIENASWDLSWKRWTHRVRPPQEYLAAERLAGGIEVYNVAVSHLRDKHWFLDPGASLRSGLHQLERQIRRQRRRIIPIGGSDSHSDYLRASTFVLAKRNTEAAIRAALVHGRVCVRAPGACTFEVGVGDGWQPVGAAVRANSGVRVRARGEEIAVLRDGRVVSRPAGGTPARIAVDPSSCTLLRARVDGGRSAPVYVNCPFAE